MKNLKLILILGWFFILIQGLGAQEKFGFSAGGSIASDPTNFNEGKGGYGELTYNLLSNFDLVFHFEKLVDFEADNDLTEDEIDMRFYTAGLRYASDVESNSRGIIGIDLGSLEIEANDSKGESTEDGQVLRLNLGVEQYLYKKTGVKISGAYLIGLGAVNELAFFDFNLGLFVNF